MKWKPDPRLLLPLLQTLLASFGLTRIINSFSNSLDGFMFIEGFCIAFVNIALSYYNLKYFLLDKKTKGNQ